MKIDNLKTAAAGLLLALLATACGSREKNNDGSKLTVAAGIPPVAYLVEAIGGDSVDVECLLPAGADPEVFDPSVQSLRSLSESDLYFSVGTLPYEDQLLKNISTNTTGLRVVTLADSITKIYGTHGDEADPHVWMSAKNNRTMARTILRALTEVRPGAKEYFTGRYMLLDSRLDSIDRAIAAQLAPAAGSAFVTGHPALTYFARDYGLRQIALSQGHKEISAKNRKEKLEETERSGALVVFTQPGPEGRMAQEAASSMKLKAVAVDPMGNDPIKEIQAACDAIATALSNSSTAKPEK